MVATVGSLNVNATLQTAQFDKNLDSMRGKLKGLQSTFASVGSKMTSIGKAMTVGITAPFAAFAAAGLKEAQETAAAMAQVNAGLKSMGPVAGRTASQLEKAANAFEGSSLFEADEILSKVTANMLTFGNISGQAFDRAQQAAIDLATRMGTDLQSATVLVGKALNDPIKGLSSLSRVGIQFSESQKTAIKAMVETGNVAGAQAIILKELERQYGGAAKAAQDADPWNKLSDSFKSLAESIGTILLPLIPPLANAFAKLADWFTSLDPATQKWVAGLGALAAAVGPVLLVAGKMVSAFGTLLPLLVKLGPAFAIVRTAALALLANPVLLGAAAVIGGIYLAWKNWDKITAIVQRVYSAVKTYLVDKFNGIVASIKDKVDAVIGFFRNLWDKVVGHSYVPDTVAAIGVEMAKLDGLMVEPARAATEKTAEAFEALKSRVAGILDRLFPQQAAGNQFLADLQDLIAYADKAKWSFDQLAAAKRALVNEHFGASTEPPVMSEDISLTPTTPDGIPAGVSEWAKMLPELRRQTDAWGESMKGVAFAAGDTLANGLTAVIEGTAKIGEVFSEVAKQIIGDIIKMTLKMLIFRAISGLFGQSSSPPMPGFNTGGTISAADLPGFATGGLVGGFGGIDNNTLSVNGIPFARVSRGEALQVIPQKDLPAGRGGDITIHQHYSFEGVAITEDRFVHGLMLAKHDTIATLRDIQRRRG